MRRRFLLRGLGYGHFEETTLRPAVEAIAAEPMVPYEVGVPVTLEGARLVEKMLYGLKGTDPLGLSSAVVALVLTGLMAGYLPARRAARVDPLIALRHE